ncbi:MAG: UDP-glucose 4-epimerase GalE [Gammaproteobacteria bacterium]|nr:UDP-glucose 4-epimerase GalE [Gammaproteobacteria bacterium]MCW5583004.1 UDP-glucose 4-epimerase GalE [Gammaproteobacteria bacterium]
MRTNSQSILIIGGAGYIGSHMVLNMLRAGYRPVVLDNLSKGHRDAVLNAELIVGEAGDAALLKQLFSKHQFAAVMHFASFIDVGESVKFPAKYYQNNVSTAITLINVMVQCGVKNFIFSSSAAVYGEPQYKTMTESHPLAPVSPYGRTKWMVEEIIKDFARSDGLNFAILRYFNAAGADPEARLCECHEPESHLIPLVLQTAAGQHPNVTIHGNQYPTVDGTCIRDYIHVVDLCNAHLLALNALVKNKKNMIYNLGTGHGYSVMQVVHAAQRVTGKSINKIIGPPRLGDVAVLVADASLVKQELHWLPKYPGLETMIQHAWKAMHLS